MAKITFYHSMICPRCHMARMSLSKLQSEFPDVEVERVEYLTNLSRARGDGVWTIPSLVAGERKLSGFYLTKRSIRRFFEQSAPGGAEAPALGDA